MKIIFLIINLFIIGQFSHALPGGWNSLGTGMNHNVQSIFIDSTDGKLYAGGPFYVAGGILARNIAKWDGISWSSLGNGNTYGQWVYAITKYQNQIYADGRYTQHNPDNFGGRFNGNNWDSLSPGVKGDIYQFKEINGLLWVGGFFDMAGNDSCSMLATWDEILGIV